MKDELAMRKVVGSLSAGGKKAIGFYFILLGE